MIRLSIIIPFYNVEQYIAQCLDSVYNQDIPEEEYEVICVNDASPDNSREIVKEYQKKHKNLILVEHEVNKKLGAARNTGRRVAKGTYIWNVDSDDMIAPNCLRSILEQCELNGLDVLMFNYVLFECGKVNQRCGAIWDDNRVCAGVTFWKEQGIKHISEIGAVWKLVIRREYLDDNNIFSPEVNMNEDVPYTYKSILLASKIKVVNAFYYLYRIISTSLTAQICNKPTGKMLYENSFVSGKALYDIVHYVPCIEKDVRKSLISVINYILVQDWKKLSTIDRNERKIYAQLVVYNTLQNIYILNVLSMKQLYFLYKNCFFTHDFNS